MDHKDLSLLARPLQHHLTTLSLLFPVKMQTCPPYSKFWNGLGHFLKSIPRVKVLRFGFERDMTYQEPQWMACETHAKRDAGPFYVPLWKIFGDHTWTELESLRLDGLMVCEKGLTKLLSSQAGTLRKLELVDIALWDGSFKALLTSVKDVLRLKEFRIWGVTQALHTQYDKWILAPTKPFDEDSMLSEQLREALAAKRSQARLPVMSSVAVTARLEAFVMGGIWSDWPMTP
ncbi:hypothetical protein ONS96_010732 [Cadophora gregata f. sp. sojae]|nr:hypothetical protein ONS96_010732 [Cadophora gregata f. sp. sojae]